MSRILITALPDCIVLRICHIRSFTNELTAINPPKLLEANLRVTSNIIVDETSIC